MTANYRTTISDKRWIAYDIPGNIGWITWLMCTVKEIREKGVIRSITAIVPAVFMLIGVCELISERIAGLDRVLPGERLFPVICTGLLSDSYIANPAGRQHGSIKTLRHSLMRVSFLL